MQAGLVGCTVGSGLLIPGPTYCVLKLQGLLLLSYYAVVMLQERKRDGEPVARVQGEPGLMQATI